LICSTIRKSRIQRGGDTKVGRLIDVFNDNILSVKRLNCYFYNALETILI